MASRRESLLLCDILQWVIDASALFQYYVYCRFESVLNVILISILFFRFFISLNGKIIASRWIFSLFFCSIELLFVVCLIFPFCEFLMNFVVCLFLWCTISKTSPKKNNHRKRHDDRVHQYKTSMIINNANNKMVTWNPRRQKAKEKKTQFWQKRKIIHLNIIVRFSHFICC